VKYKYHRLATKDMSQPLTHLSWHERFWNDPAKKREGKTKRHNKFSAKAVKHKVPEQQGDLYPCKETDRRRYSYALEEVDQINSAG
jgi:hypothetical protein